MGMVSLMTEDQLERLVRAGSESARQALSEMRMRREDGENVAVWCEAGVLFVGPPPAY